MSSLAQALPEQPFIVIPIVAGVGNALLAVPMVRRLKSALPAARIRILARTDAMAEPFRRLPEVSETQVTGKDIASLFRAVRSERPDVFLTPFPSNRWQYSLLALASGAAHKILHRYPAGYWRSLGFVGERVPAIRGLHDVEQNLRLLTALGINPGAPEPPAFNLRQDDRASANELLKSAGIDGDDSFIAIHAGSAGTILARAKRWPAEKYARIITSLLKEFGHRIALLEGPDEAGVASDILNGISDPRAHCLKLTGPLGDAAAVLERATLYVGSDSGLAHLAAAVGTRSITLFAPADSQRVCPFANDSLVVKSANACSPCFMYPWQTPYPKMKCREPFCIDGIEVERVLAKVRSALIVASHSGSGFG